jgi:hypothetical protein
MSLSRSLVLLGFLAASQSVSIGSALRPGMSLVYSSGGVETPWIIDSVRTDSALHGRRPCALIWLRTSPSQTAAQLRSWCTDSASMFAWDERTAAFRAVRPLAPGTRLELSLANGGRSVYETAERTVEVISGRSIDVVVTTVTTADSTGRVVQRLRERFSIALATATGGTFEVPDSAHPGGWRTTRAFELVAIRPR